MANVLVVDPEKCTTCRLCEIVCSERAVGAFQPARSHIRVAIDSDKAFYFPMICLQCEKAECVEACPTKALVRDEQTGVVTLVPVLCEECGACEPACPYGAIHCRTGKPEKCELCGGDPECVRFCSPGALRYEDPANWPKAERTAYANRLAELVEEGEW